MNICLIFNERPVLNRLRLVRTSNQSRSVLIGFLQSLIGPVWFFEVLGLCWTGLGLGLSPWRSKTKTGPDFQSLLVGQDKSSPNNYPRAFFPIKCTSNNPLSLIVALGWVNHDGDVATDEKAGLEKKVKTCMTICACFFVKVKFKHL